MQRAATLGLQELLQQQRQYVNHFFEHLHLPRVEEVLEACLQCRGFLVLTGVGKSGIIAEKIAMTLISLGTRALFLPSINFLHGDIGALSPEDIVLMLSKSGETRELLELVPYIRDRGTKIISLVSEGESRLAKASDLFVELPVEKELCPFDLAPTTSTTVQLLFGDLLAIALMQEKKFGLEAYASNHPAGAIGKRITLRVEELMKKGNELPLCHLEDRLIDLLVELTNKRLGCLLVVGHDEQLKGIFTDGDLRRALQQSGGEVLNQKMKDLMHTNPIQVAPQDLLYDAVKKMQGARYVMMAPVTDQGRVVGLIHMHDIVQAGIK